MLQYASSFWSLRPLVTVEYRSPFWRAADSSTLAGIIPFQNEVHRPEVLDYLHDVCDTLEPGKPDSVAFL
ncbi:hypothetical protein D3C71_2148790 [compost metagenome]